MIEIGGAASAHPRAGRGPASQAGSWAGARAEGPVRARADTAVDEVPDAPLREAITLAAALGFAAGAAARLALGGFDGYGWALRALAVPPGAIAAAVVAGVLVNLTLIPALTRLVPGGALPARVYAAAGALCGLAAFAGAFAEFGPPAA